VVQSSFFIGVVSHADSRFAVNQSPEGLAARLSGAIEERGLGVEMVIKVDNPWDEGIAAGTLDSRWQVPLDSAAVQRSLSAQLSMERKWDSFLGGHSVVRRIPRFLMLGIGRLRRRLQSPHPAMVRRLLNIELSHLGLLTQGHASGATWVVILEDDAVAQDVGDVVDGLIGMMDWQDVAYANLSASFGLRQLRVDALLQSDTDHVWLGQQPRSVLRSSRPITNTVCAIAYHSSFIPELLQAWDQMPVDPVLPIDWKLNAAVINLYRRGALDPARGGRLCLTIEPAPIDQMSMRDSS